MSLVNLLLQGSKRAGAYLNTGQPLSDGREALLSCDVIHHKHSVGLAEELFGDASIPAGGAGSQ